MPRIQFSDVTPPERRSIRDIPIPNSGKRKAPTVIRPEKKPVSKLEPMSDPDVKISETIEKKEGGNNKNFDESLLVGKQTKKKRWMFGIIIFSLIVIFIVSMMTVFASATINITPKSQNFDVNTKIVSTREVEKDAVRYEIIKLSESKTASVPASGEEATEIKASGKIVIYNNFSIEPQRLIVRTRFESPEGLIYRIPESVTVPGKSIKNGVETPGSIEVKVFADEAGEKYSIKKTDFTIPGFKNDANRYKNFYARSSTEMTGGFVGKRKIVLPADKMAALQNIDSEAQTDLKKELDSKVPEGLVLLAGSIIFNSNELPMKEETSSVMIGKEVTAYAVMLNVQDLSDRIASEYISNLPEWNNIKPIIENFSLLSIVDLPNNPETNEKMDLQISGKVRVWASIDTNIINQRLLGVPKKEVAKLMDEFVGISSITSAIRPIWKQSFPKDSFKIHIKIITSK